MATVNVTHWSEFLNAIQVAGDTVVCPVGGEWDLTDAEPITQPIEIACSEIKGNGTTIKRPSFNVSGDYAIRNANDLTISGLHWDSISFLSSTSMPDAFWEFSGKNLYLSGCIISAVLTGGSSGLNIGFNGYCWFTSCAMTVTCGRGCTKLMYGSSASNGESVFCRYQLNITQTGSVQPFHYLRKCEVIVNVTTDPENAGGVKFDNNVSACVIRGTTGVNGVYYGIGLADYTYNTLSVVADTIHSYAAESDNQLVWQGIVCSDSQMRDAEYLASVIYDDYSFPLGDGDEDWHTGDIAINGGYPYIPKMIGLPVIELHPVDQIPYITIFPITTAQNEFTGNGLAILSPSVCEVAEDLNGQFAFSMEHPIDPEGKWQQIELRNIMQIDGQLFTILHVEVDWQNNSGLLRCSGEHIWYQLADGWCFPADAISAVTGNAYILNVKAHTTTYSTEIGAVVYDFTGSSDIVLSSGVIVKGIGDGCTPVDALIGSGGLSDQSDTGYAELYRDNFTYSINYRMQGARDNAFDIRIGRDLRGIKRTFDTSEFCSYFRAYDQYGNWWAVAWVISSFIERRFPHHIIRSKRFDVDVWEFGFAPLVSQGMAFFRRNCKPIIGYEIDLEDVRNNPDFSMIMHVERLKVGDSGTVYDERLGGNLEIKISGTVFDAVHNKMKKITVGDRASFSAPSASTVEIEPEVVGGELYMQDGDGNFIEDGDGKLIYQEVISNA